MVIRSTKDLMFSFRRSLTNPIFGKKNNIGKKRYISASDNVEYDIMYFYATKDSREYYETVRYVKGTNIENLPSLPTIEGYEFTGWDINYETNRAYGIYTNGTYYLKFYFNYGKGDNVLVQETPITYNTLIGNNSYSYPDVNECRSGYTFNRWSINKSTLDEKINYTQGIYGYFEKEVIPTYTCYFIAQFDNQSSTITYKTIKYESGSTVTITYPSYEGYTINYTYLVKGGVNYTLEGKTFTMSDSNVKVITYLTAGTFTLTFLNGSETVYTKNIKVGTILTNSDFPSVSPTAPTGQYFVRWDGEVTIGDSMPGHNVTMNALFNSSKVSNVYYYVIYNNSSSLYKNKESYYEGETVKRLDRLSEEGYNYTEWTSSTVDVIDGSFTMPGKDVTFNCVKTAKKYTLTINYYYDNAIKNTTTSGINYNSIVNLTSYENNISGYYFSGYTIENDSITVNNDSFYMPSENVTITLIYGKSYSVTYFLSYNGDESQDGTVTYYPPNTVVTLQSVCKDTTTIMYSGYTIIGDSNYTFNQSSGTFTIHENVKIICYKYDKTKLTINVYKNNEQYGNRPYLFTGGTGIEYTTEYIENYLIENNSDFPTGYTYSSSTLTNSSGNVRRIPSKTASFELNTGNTLSIYYIDSSSTEEDTSNTYYYYLGNQEVTDYNYESLCSSFTYNENTTYSDIDGIIKQYNNSSSVYRSGSENMYVFFPLKLWGYTSHYGKFWLEQNGGIIDYIDVANSNTDKTFIVDIKPYQINEEEYICIKPSTNRTNGGSFYFCYG